VTGCEDDFELAAAEIDAIAIANRPRDLPRTNRIRIRANATRQSSANALRSKSVARVDVGLAFSVLSTVGDVLIENFREFEITASVVEMRVRVQHAYRQFRELRHNILDAGHSKPGVEEKCAIMAEDQVRDDFFELVRLVDRKNVGTNPVDLEPVTVNLNACETFVFGPWQLLSPLGAQGLARILRRGLASKRAN
jgi:hypothetical protein